MNKLWNKYKTLILLLIICIIIFVGLLLFGWNYISKPNEFGDSAGWINGLFSALAFAGVVYAIFMQKDELELQRGELAAQRSEFQMQNDTLKRQRFENTFFNMLQLHQQITDNITYSYGYNEENIGWQYDDKLTRFKYVKVNLKGREVFRESFERAPHSIDDNKCCEGMRKLIQEYGLYGYENNFTPTYFDHYFRNLYRIIKFIDRSNLIKDEDRYEYSAIVRGQLSRYELIWLYYNGLSSYGREKFKPLIEKYTLLDNIREELLVDTDLGIEYQKNAFGLL